MNTLKEFDALYNSHKSFTLKIADLIKSLLSQNNITYHLIENRTKTQISYAEKIVRKNQNSNINDEITDISGIRIIAYYQKDVDIIAEIIKTEFEVDEKNSIDKSRILKENEFGYQSVHYVVKINPERAKLTEWISYKDLKAEIQIRTVLQHSWASISHELQYKKTYDIPNTLKRKLFRLAGLFELADEQFGELKTQHFELEQKVSSENKTSKRIVSNEINLITINEFISNSETVKKVEESALKGGFSEEDFGDDFRTESEIQKEHNENLSELIGMLNKVNIKTIDELESYLKNSLKFSINYFKDLVGKADYNVWRGSKEFYVRLLLMLKMEEIDVEYYESIGWGKHTLSIVKEIAKKYSS